MTALADMLVNVARANHDSMHASLDHDATERKRLVAKVALLESINVDLLTALRGITNIPGLTDHEADRLNAREAWNGAMSRVYSRAQTAVAAANPLCEKCEERLRLPSEDLCQNCLDNEAEADYDRAQEGECFRGGEAAAHEAEQQERARRLK